MKLFKKMRLNSRGFSHIELFIVLLVLVGVSGAGYYVYQINKGIDVSHAGSWTQLSYSTLGYSPGPTAIACSTEVAVASPGFGPAPKPYYRIQVEMTANNTTVAKIAFTTDEYVSQSVSSGGYSLVSTNSSSVWSGTGQDTAISVPNGDRASIYLVTGNTVAGYFYNPAQPTSTGQDYLLPADLSPCTPTPAPSPTPTIVGTPKPTVTPLPVGPATPAPPSYTEVGTVSLPQQNEVVTAYACTLKQSTTSEEVETYFTLSNSYKSGTWEAGVVNEGSDPLKGYQAVYQDFSDTTSPTAYLNTYIDPQVNSPLSFTYSAGSDNSGATVSGQVSSTTSTSYPNPDNFVSCS